METKTILDIVYYSVCALLFVGSFAIGVVQRAKQKNTTKLQALYECIPNAVINAEKLFGKGNGENKKLFVMTELINIALQSHTKYDYAELDKQVENVVKATKNVNVVESVTETFCENVEQETEKITDNSTVDTTTQNDGAVVIEIDKIKESEENGSDN